jgi:MSHA biogenesis protein MshE
MTTIGRKLRLGELLVQNGVISAEQLKNALSEQRRTGRKLGRILRDLELLTDAQLHEFLSKHLQVPFVDLQQIRIDREAVKLLPEPLARRFRALVLEQDARGLLVAMPDPTDMQAYDELKAQLKHPMRVALVGEADFLKTLETVYRRTTDGAPVGEAEREELADGGIDLATLCAEENSPDAPVLRLLQTMFQEAVRTRASYLHLEPAGKKLRLRLRVDGVLQEQIIEAQPLAGAFMSRLKLMGGLNIGERQLPQEGRCIVRVGAVTIDVRMASLPTMYGESLVLRLLKHSAARPSLDLLGMPAAIAQRFRRLVERSAGMVLVTGPAGSGKTTTLYAAIKHLNRPGIKIVTVEDPVEYRLDRVTQLSVQTKSGLDFARVLGTVLRQDPDLLLVGELRDPATVEMAFHAAMSGRLVLSSLPTINAIATLNRLLDMGAAGFTVAATVQGVLAQRLVRRLCTECAQPGVPTPDELAWLRDCRPNLAVEGVRFMTGAGCSSCNQTGFAGRAAVFELLEIDRRLADAVRRAELDEIARTARGSESYLPMAQSAIELALAGTTSLAEAMAAGCGLETLGDPAAEGGLPGTAVEELLEQRA